MLSSHSSLFDLFICTQFLYMWPHREVWQSRSWHIHSDNVSSCTVSSEVISVGTASEECKGKYCVFPSSTGETASEVLCGILDSWVLDKCGHTGAGLTRCHKYDEETGTPALCTETERDGIIHPEGNNMIHIFMCINTWWEGNKEGRTRLLSGVLWQNKRYKHKYLKAAQKDSGATSLEILKIHLETVL